jgi:BlaI family transcriptional regulator, penicillinase repressor
VASDRLTFVKLPKRRLVGVIAVSVAGAEPDQPTLTQLQMFLQSADVHLSLSGKGCRTMGERPSLSRGEMEVARILWDLGTATVRQVHDAFPPNRKMDFSTVQTYLRRLEGKGYARAKLEGRTRVYSPKIKPAIAIRDTLGDLVDRLFGGKAFSLVRHLIEDQGISDEDFAQLQQLVKRLERERDGSTTKTRRKPSETA